MKYFVIPICRVIFTILWLMIFRPFRVVILTLQALWLWDMSGLKVEFKGPFFEYCTGSYIGDDEEGNTVIFDEYKVYKAFTDLLVNNYEIRQD